MAGFHLLMVYWSYKVVVSGGMVEFWLRDLTLQRKTKRKGWDAEKHNH